jgi:hypothetical protein
MFAVKEARWLNNGPKAKPWLRAILVVPALISTIATAQSTD